MKQNHWDILTTVIFCINLEQMCKHTATTRNTQPTMVQHRLTCALKNARLLPDGFCCLNKTGNKILFKLTGDE
jgi:hypothetical protein